MLQYWYAERVLNNTRVGLLLHCDQRSHPVNDVRCDCSSIGWQCTTAAAGFTLTIPWEGEARLVRPPLHRQRQDDPCPWAEPQLETRAVNNGAALLTTRSNRDDLVLAVRTSLDIQPALLHLVRVDELDGSALRRHPCHQRGNVLRDPRPEATRVEVTQPAVQREAVAWRDPAEHELDEAGARADGCAAGGRRIELQKVDHPNHARKRSDVNVDGSIEIWGNSRSLHTARP